MSIEEIFEQFRAIRMPDADRWALSTEIGRDRYCGEWGEMAARSEKLVQEIDQLRCSRDVRTVDELLSRMRKHLEECQKLGDAGYMVWNGGVPRTDSFVKYMVAEIVGRLRPQLFKEKRLKLGVTRDLRVVRGAERQWDLEEERAELLEAIEGREEG
jgi:hypothetical protein